MPSIADVYSQAAQYHQAGNLQAAEQLCRQILQVDASHPDAHHLLGIIASQVGRHDLGAQHLSFALSRQPSNAALHANLGIMLQHQGKVADAIASYRHAIRLQPNSPEALSNLGNALKVYGHLDDAVASCREAIRLRPTFADAHNNLGNALSDQGKLDDAVASLRETLRLRPDFADAHNNLANVQAAQGRLDEAVASYREALRLQPDFLHAHSNLLLCLNYHPGIDAETVYAEHRRWEAEQGQTTLLPPPVKDRDPERRLRVGYVSADFREHTVARFVEPILAHHDPQRVEAFCYAEVRAPDSMTAHFQKLCKGWRWTCGVQDNQVANQIRSDGIDIVVDLGGHTAGSRLRVFTFKPAPVQVTYLGYANTTGLKTMDYRLTDAVADPPGEAGFYTEELIRLPDGFCCYRPPEAVPAVNELPADRTGSVTFGAFHHLSKLNPAVLDVWSAILREMPEARLLIFRHTLIGSVQEQLRRQFADRGIGGERLELRHAGSAGLKHWYAYQEVDISLDAFPWSGHTTACESLWMGVPVVTLRGTRHAGRMVASVLTRLDLQSWIADTPEKYVELAVTQARDREGLGALRAGLRERMRASPLGDGPGFARALENAYREMWRRWCGC